MVSGDPTKDLSRAPNGQHRPGEVNGKLHSSRFGSEGRAQERAGSVGGGGRFGRNGVGSREPPEPDVENYVRKATVLARIFILETN